MVMMIMFVDAGCDDRDDGVGCHIIDDNDTDDSDYVSNDGTDDRQHKQYKCDYILGVIIHELPRLLGETSYHHD